MTDCCIRCFNQLKKINSDKQHTKRGIMAKVKIQQENGVLVK